MDEAVRARDAAREALTDIEPDRLGRVIDDRLASASMTPGALVLVSAKALDSGADLDAVADRAAGVQLIYEGLRLTRRLAREEPWADADGAADVAADLEILAADVLVSRGFYLLARTEAAERAVETVRAFGRDRTERRTSGADGGGDAETDRALEADVFELAVVAGATAVGTLPAAPLRAYAAGLARGFEGDGEGGLPGPDRALPEAAAERIATLSEDPVASPTDD